jgi:hypothetical protein
LLSGSRSDSRRREPTPEESAARLELPRRAADGSGYPALLREWAMTTENRNVERRLAETNRHLQAVRTALMAANAGFGGRSFGAEETLRVLSALNNAIVDLMQAVTILNGGHARHHQW